MAPNARNGIELYSMVGDTSRDQYQSNHSMLVGETCGSTTEEQSDAFNYLNRFRDKICCIGSLSKDEDVIVLPTNSVKEKGEKASQSCMDQPSRIEVLFQNFLDVYHNEIIAHAKFQRSENASSQQTMTYISEEEKYFAKRWDGYQPLTSMPVGNADAAPRKTLKRKKLMPANYAKSKLYGK